MDQPQRTRVALALAALIVVAAIVATMLILPKERPSPPAPTSKEQLSSGTAASPETPPPELRRGDLAEAAARAASAYAAGEDYPSEDKLLAGRRFEAVIPFGCDGPGPTVANPAQWTIDQKQKAITLRAEPQDWTDTPWVRTATGALEGERVEGVWLPRPWIMAETCPAARARAAASTGMDAAGKGEAAQLDLASSEQTLGLVRVFASDASRVGQRRNRPYQVVRKVDDDETGNGPHEFHLVLRGRVVPLTSGETIVCHAEVADRRPVCLVSTAIEQVAFRDPATGETLAEWTD